MAAHADGFQLIPGSDQRRSTYGSHRWPYRLILAGRPAATIHHNTFEWNVPAGGEVTLMMALGGTEQEASGSPLSQLTGFPTFSTKKLIAFGTPISPRRRSSHGHAGQLHDWHHRRTKEHQSRGPRAQRAVVLASCFRNTTCQVSYLPATPLMIADWNVFVGMWSNDGIAEAIALAATNREKCRSRRHPQLVSLLG